MNSIVQKELKFGKIPSDFSIKGGTERKDPDFSIRGGTKIGISKLLKIVFKLSFCH